MEINGSQTHSEPTLFAFQVFGTTLTSHRNKASRTVSNAASGDSYMWIFTKFLDFQSQLLYIIKNCIFIML